MVLSLRMFLIVCPLLFLAGFVDAIGGGGGLISLPAYIFAGLPIHTAIATNKLSSACGTSLATARFLKSGLVNLRLVLPGVAAAILGSALGARRSLLASEELVRRLLLMVLPVAAFFVLNPKLFRDREEAVQTDRRAVLACGVSALVIGLYDGFYGPGTGTFLIIAFTVFAHMSVRAANAQAKVINLTTNVTSLVVFLLNGQVLIPLGLAAAACNMLGNYLGSGLVLTKGSKIVRPIILVVLVLLLIKILTE
ncbi:MAG: TSUP family transporter [Oscillospiraceae bacterium]|nr:TSUP family transporter [Oscillospiraceae bacterium]